MMSLDALKSSNAEGDNPVDEGEGVSEKKGGSYSLLLAYLLTHSLIQTLTYSLTQVLVLKILKMNYKIIPMHSKRLKGTSKKFSES